MIVLLIFPLYRFLTISAFSNSIRYMVWICYPCISSPHVHIFVLHFLFFWENYHQLFLILLVYYEWSVPGWTSRFSPVWGELMLTSQLISQPLVQLRSKEPKIKQKKKTLFSAFCRIFFWEWMHFPPGFYIFPHL